MKGTIHHRPVRPLPGSDATEACVRPAGWRDVLRGWPADLPMDRRLRDRVEFELSRASVQDELHQRSDGRLKARGRASLTLLIAPLVYLVARGLAANVFGATLLAMLLPMLIAIPLVVFLTVRITRRVVAPRFRAGLRREGIDCCVACGHLIGRGHPADTCPECGRAHDRFPLGWGPAPINTPGASLPTATDDPEP
jgi:hypothetical protein